MVLSYTTEFIHLHRRVGGRKEGGREGGKKEEERVRREEREGERREEGSVEDSGGRMEERKITVKYNCVKHPLGPLFT